MARGYKIFMRPIHLSDNFPELLVLDEKGIPFSPLTDFYHSEVQRVTQKSARSYLQALIPFFNWLDQYSEYQKGIIHWQDQPEIIREGVRTYLIDYLDCKVSEAPRDAFLLVRFTKKSSSTARQFLSALKNFYRFMIRKSCYLFENPMIDSNMKFFVKEGSIRMPDIAGTEVPLPKRRITDSYFKLVGSEWIPEIIDDPLLPSKVLDAGHLHNWRLRDKVIARLLFETGARATEIIRVCIGDYRNRSSVREMATFNKGSYGKRIKFLAFSNQTATLLKRYINGERRNNDPNHLAFDELPNDAPMFLTERGTPYSYQAWYAHWTKATKSGGLQINPHKTRHWYVTQALRTIYETTSAQGEIERKTRELIAYMKWESKETIEVYEHYFDARKHLEIHDKFLKRLDWAAKQYLSKSSSKIDKPVKNTAVQSNQKQKVDPIETFLLELE